MEAHLNPSKKRKIDGSSSLKGKDGKVRYFQEKWTALGTLQDTFKTRFQDFQSSTNMLKIFSSSFTADIATSPSELQMELIDL